MAALVADGFDVNQPNKAGDTPLYIACNNGHTEVVSKLIRRERQRGQANNNSATPLISSPAASGHTEIVTRAGEANANVDQAAQKGLTPLYFACQHGPRRDRHARCSPRTPT